jgi:colanic acid/amylovoran biosynthesis glycosyltransferase
MNVLFVVHWFPKLSETFVVNQITGLLERGINVAIYARWLGDTTKMHPAIERFRLLQRATYAHEVLEEEFVPPEHEAYQDDLQLLRLQESYPELRPYILAYASRTGRPEYDETTRRLFYACVPVLQQAPFDIIHCQFGTLVDEALFLKRATGSKLVVSFRGFDITSYVHRRGLAIYQQLFREGDAFLPNCDYFQSRLLAIGCADEKMTLVRSGIDTRRFPFNPCPLKPSERVRILTVGRLVEKKGIAHAIRAVARLLERGHSLEYTIVGEGELRGDLERLIRELDVREHVRLLGAKAPRDVVELFGQSHLFVAPSVTASNGDQDGPPNVLKEAMLTGLPVIASDHGGIPELIEDGVSGFLVPEGSSEEIAAKIEILLEHPERWPEMGKKARASVESRYDAEALNDRLVNVYERLLGSHLDSSQHRQAQA